MWKRATAWKWHQGVANMGRRELLGANVAWQHQHLAAKTRFPPRVQDFTEAHQLAKEKINACSKAGALFCVPFIGKRATAAAAGAAAPPALLASFSYAHAALRTALSLSADLGLLRTARRAAR